MSASPCHYHRHPSPRHPNPFLITKDFEVRPSFNNFTHYHPTVQDHQSHEKKLQRRSFLMVIQCQKDKPKQQNPSKFPFSLMAQFCLSTLNSILILVPLLLFVLISSPPLYSAIIWSFHLSCTFKLLHIFQELTPWYIICGP